MTKPERSLKARVCERKKIVLISKLACHVDHVNECYHHMHFENVEVVEHETHYHQWLFLEAWIFVKKPTLSWERPDGHLRSLYLNALKIQQVTRNVSFQKVFYSSLTSIVFFN